jgi:hypothetical protein
VAPNRSLSISHLSSIVKHMRSRPMSAATSGRVPSSGAVYSTTQTPPVFGQPMYRNFLSSPSGGSSPVSPIWIFSYRRLWGHQVPPILRSDLQKSSSLFWSLKRSIGGSNRSRPRYANSTASALGRMMMPPLDGQPEIWHPQ